MVYIGKLEATGVATPVGRIWVAASDEGVVAISLWDDEAQFRAEVARLTGAMPESSDDANPILTTTLAELDAYLRGQLRQFTSRIEWSTMKPFQREALELVCDVPYGRTTTYGAIAQRLGKPGAVRAVGRANATNPLPIIIPCHRVLGADGKLHGYGARGGLETKAWLLRLEGSWLI
jgi:methylated-DNA-[protein]-cysteine S-methyltransferase